MGKISSKRTILTSFLVDLGDIALNVTGMLITGSVVLLAEALEGGSDLVASGLLLVGLRISNKRANKKHPFGLAKLSFPGKHCGWSRMTNLFRPAVESRCTARSRNDLPQVFA